MLRDRLDSNARNKHDIAFETEVLKTQERKEALLGVLTEQKVVRLQFIGGIGEKRRIGLKNYRKACQEPSQ